MFQRVISIEIGYQKTRICEVEYRQKKAYVYQHVSFDTPKDVFDDGYIRDKEKFVEAAKTVLQESNIKSKKVVFTIASSKIANKEVNLPLIKEKRIQDVIEVNASDYFPVEISDYTLTYSILEKTNTKEDKKLRISVFAAPNSLIKNYYSIASMLNLDVVAVDYIGNSVYQVLKNTQSKKTELFIQINEQTTLISVLRGGILKLQRTVPYGTDLAVEAILQNRFFVMENEEQAAQLLYNQTYINHQLHMSLGEVAATVVEVDDDYMNNQALRYDITESLNLLINNILRVIDYYSSKYPTEKIEEIFITGQGSRVRGMKELIKHETGLVVNILEELPLVVFPKDDSMTKKEQSDYIASIGAATRSINFLPKEYLLSEKKQNRIHTRIVMLFGSCLISFFLLLTSYLNVKNEEQDIAQLTQQIAYLSEIDGIYTAHMDAKNQYSTVKEMYDATNHPNKKLGELISVLEEKLPSNSSLESFMIASNAITLSIKADSKETAAIVLQQLKSTPILSQINTSGITVEDDKNGIVTVRFVVTAQYSAATEEVK